MKVTLTFDLPAEQEEYDITMHAHRFSRVLSDFAEYLRRQVKYVEPENRDDVVKVRERFYEYLANERVEL